MEKLCTAMLNIQSHFTAQKGSVNLGVTTGFTESILLTMPYQPDPVLHFGYQSLTLPKPREVIKRRISNVADVDIITNINISPELVVKQSCDSSKYSESNNYGIVTRSDHSFMTTSSRKQECECLGDKSECCANCGTDITNF